MSDEIKTWSLDQLPGDGRGGIFFNREPTEKEMCGLELVSYDGYDDEDDDWDDFGSQYYQVTVKGTEAQVKKFIDENFYGDGDYWEN